MWEIFDRFISFIYNFTNRRTNVDLLDDKLRTRFFEELSVLRKMMSPVYLRRKRERHMSGAERTLQNPTGTRNLQDSTPGCHAIV